MGEVHQVSEYEFRRYRVSFFAPLGTLIVDEKEWYVGSSPEVLGVIILDRIDGDWNFVMLTPDDRGDFRAEETGTSFSTIESAREALLRLMTKHTEPLE